MGHFGHGYRIVVIEATAHPNVLAEPKYFEAAPFEQVVFVDAFGNKIIISPESKSVWASFTEGSAHLVGIPEAYKDYFITFGMNVPVTSADVDAILRWRSATDLRAIDHSNLASKLLDRIDAMSNMKVLECFSLELTSAACRQLDVNPFLKRLPALQHAHFTTEALTPHEVDVFVRRQDVNAAEWKLDIIENFSVTYSKVDSSRPRSR